MKKMMMIIVAVLTIGFTALTASASSSAIVFDEVVYGRVNSIVKTGNFEYIYTTEHNVPDEILDRLSDIYQNKFNCNENTYCQMMYQPLFDRGYTVDNFKSSPIANDCYTLHGLKDDTIRYLAGIETDDYHGYIVSMTFNSKNEFIDCKIVYEH